MKKLIIIIIVLLAVGGVGYGVYLFGKSQQSASNTDISKEQDKQIQEQMATDPLSAACSNLSLSKGKSEGAAGTTYLTVIITNNGNQDCSLSGYPTVSVKDNQQAEVKATKNSLYPTSLVKLAAKGGKAHIVIGLPNAANFDPGTAPCTESTSSTLYLTPPGINTTATLGLSQSACDGMTTTAVHAGIAA